jgi:glycerol-3-phosphate acyltransferase PlsY
MLWIITAIFVSYLIGSFPSAYCFGRLKGIDIRKSGSGNVGATNALRVLGRGAGIAVLTLDIFKGVFVVLFLANYFSARVTFMQEQNLRIIMGLCCIFGHIWTVFLNFKGGKGIATTFGVLIGLAFKIPALNVIVGLLVITWLVVFLFTRIVSLASLLAGLLLPIYAVLFKLPLLLVIACIFLFILVLFRHKANLARLFQGKEPRLYFKKHS